MKKVLLVISTISLITMAAASSAREGGCRHGGGSMQHLSMASPVMAEILDLTDTQITEIRNVLKENRKEHRRIKKADRQNLHDLDPGSADYQQQVKSLVEDRVKLVESRMLNRADIHKKVYTILTPEQRSKMKNLREKMQSRSHKRHHKAQHGNPSEDVSS